MQAVAGSGHLVAGRYRLQRPLGRGAMGIVWRGRDELLHRDVAVKQVQITALATPTDAEIIYQRTLREARTAARLSHPNVVTVFDVVEEDGSPWIVMELVRARSLDLLIAEDGPLPPLAAARVGENLLSALATAHAASVLHRDVKPSNVLLTPDGRAVLTDFGIATFEGDPGLTQAGMVIGTPGFTAPERIRGNQASPASDLWSLGATLYAAVEGRGPFDRPGGSIAIMAGVVDEDAPRAPSAGSLGPVIDALLRADPSQRPDSATAARLLASAVAQAQAGPRPLASGWPADVPADAAGRYAASAAARAANDAATSEAGTITHPVLQAAAADPAGPASAAEPGRAGAAAAGPGLAGPGRAGPGPAGAAARPGRAGAAAVPGPAGAAAGSGPAGAAAAGAGPAGPGPAGAGPAGPANAGDGAPAFMEPPAFADLKMPDSERGDAELPLSADLPAFMDGPRFAGQPGLPPDNAVPWSRANAPAGRDPHDPLNLPDSDDHAAAAAGTSPAGQPARRNRGRALTAAAAVAVLAVAGVIGWSAYSHLAGVTPAQAQPVGRTRAHVPAVAVPAHHPRTARPTSGTKTTRPGAAGTTTTSKTHPSPSRSAQPSRPAKPSPVAKGGSSGPGTGKGGGGTGKGSSGGGPPPPAGYQWHVVTAASLGTTAGFKIAVPDSWQLTRQGLLTYLDAPNTTYIEVDLSAFAYPGPVREAEYLQAQAKADDAYPSYHRLLIGPGVYQGVADGIWRFWWQQHGLGRIAVLKILCTLPTSAGKQSYALTVSARAANFAAAHAVFETALRTFKPLP